MNKYVTILATIFLLLFIGQSYAQIQNADHWRFGNWAGIDFSSGSAVSVIGSPLRAGEGSASYSDDNGNLLFYTNAVEGNGFTSSIWNSNDQVMPNGNITGLFGEATPMQSSIIVPVVDSQDEYYLFTVDGYENYYTGNYKGLSYSIIDMSMDGGQGDISSVTTSIYAPTSPWLAEHVAVTRHINMVDYWLVVHEDNSWTNQDTCSKFLVYEITNAGISSPIIQFIGDGVGQGLQSTMEFSPQGDKLAYTHEIFDFDRSNGCLLYTSPSPRD